MGFFSINTTKLPKDGELPVIQNQVWFPDLEKPGERARVLNQPGISPRLNVDRDSVDADASIFEINKDVKGPFAKVSSARPGIVARSGETTFEVHLPVKMRPFDIGSLAVQEVQFAPEFVQTYEVESGSHLGQLAVARAIKAYVSNPQPIK